MSTSHVSVTIENISSVHKPDVAGQANVIKRFILSCRPYFDVPNKQIPHRLMASLMPPIFSSYSKVYADFKGPLILIWLLNFILFLGLSNKHNFGYWDSFFQSFKLSFGYWLVFSTMSSLLAFLCQTLLSKRQIFSLCGYSLSGHCMVLLLSNLHPADDRNHTIFFSLTALFGGLSVIRFAMILLTRTPRPAQRLLLCAFPSSIHLLHLIYCYLAFIKGDLSVVLY